MAIIEMGLPFPHKAPGDQNIFKTYSKHIKIVGSEAWTWYMSFLARAQIQVPARVDATAAPSQRSLRTSYNQQD